MKKRIVNLFIASLAAMTLTSSAIAATAVTEAAPVIPDENYVTVSEAPTGTTLEIEDAEASALDFVAEEMKTEGSAASDQAEVTEAIVEAKECE